MNVNPGWGQRGSLLPETDAEAGEVLKFSDLNYQGIDLGGSYDVSGKEHVRLTSGLRLVVRSRSVRLVLVQRKLLM